MKGFGIWAWLEISLYKLIKCSGQETGVSSSYAFTATRVIKFHVYEMTVLH
jgi:hypothetical protein